MTKASLVTMATTIVVMIALAIVIWGFDKGFDLTDGGCYLLRYQENQPSEPCEYWFEHFLVKATIPPYLRTVKGLRWIAFMLDLLATLVFAIAISYAHKKMHGTRINYPQLVLMMLAAFIVSLTGLPTELSYNTLNQFFLILAAGLLVLSITYEGAMSYIFAFSGGVACSMLYLIKLPSGLSFSIVGILVLLLSGDSRWRKAGSFLGANIVALLLLGILFKPNFALHYYHAYLENFTDKSIHNPSMLMQSFKEAIIMEIKTFAIAIPISTAFWLQYLKRGYPRQKTIFWGLGLFLITVYYSIHVIEHLLGLYVVSSFFLMTIFLLLFAVVLQTAGLKGNIYLPITAFKEQWRFLPLFVLLILVPYVGAEGSYVPMDSISKFYFASFMGLIALMLPMLKFRYTKQVILGLSLYLTVVGLFHYVKFPFGHGPLYKQTIEYKGIKYQPGRALFLRRTEAILKRHGFDKEQGLVIAYTAPGVAYLMETFHPGGILWKEMHQDGYFRNLKKSKLKFKPVIIALRDTPSDEFIAGFNNATGLDFQRDYRLVDDDPNYKGFSSVCVFFPHTKEMPPKRVELQPR